MVKGQTKTSCCAFSRSLVLQIMILVTEKGPKSEADSHRRGDGIRNF